MKGRSEWCLSRQRSWGVPLPAFYHVATGEALLTEETETAGGTSTTAECVDATTLPSASRTSTAMLAPSADAPSFSRFAWQCSTAEAARRPPSFTMGLLLLAAVVVLGAVAVTSAPVMLAYAQTPFCAACRGEALIRYWCRMRPPPSYLRVREAGYYIIYIYILNDMIFMVLFIMYNV